MATIHSRFIRLCAVCVAAGTVVSARANEIIDVSDAFNPSKLSPKQRAEVLVNAAEKLMSPAGMLYAADLVNVSLLDDPGNRKAQFYRRVLAPFLPLQGYVRRVDDLANRIGTSSQKASQKSTVDAIPERGGYREFLMGGEEPSFKSEADIQRMIDQSLLEVDKLRLFLKANKDMKFEVTWYNDLTEHKGKQVSLKKVQASCNVIALDEHRFQVDTSCPYYKPVRLKVDRGDIESMQLISAGAEIYLGFLNAYNLSGYGEIEAKNNRRDERGQRQLTDQEIIQILRGKSSFGALRAANNLKSIPSLAADAMAGFRWFKKFQSQFCRAEKSQVGAGFEFVEYLQTERPDHFIQNGLCVYPKSTDLFEEVSAKVDFILSGKIVTETIKLEVWDESTNRMKVLDQGNVRVDYTRPFTSPETNLKNVLPETFNRCGDSTSIKDQTLMGSFPDRDANRALQLLGAIPGARGVESCATK